MTTFYSLKLDHRPFFHDTDHNDTSISHHFILHLINVTSISINLTGFFHGFFSAHELPQDFQLLRDELRQEQQELLARLTALELRMATRRNSHSVPRQSSRRFLNVFGTSKTKQKHDNFFVLLCLIVDNMFCYVLLRCWNMLRIEKRESRKHIKCLFSNGWCKKDKGHLEIRSFWSLEAYHCPMQVHR